MMDWTDRHCRFFHRLLSGRARLYTEMVTAEAVLHGDRARLLGFSAEEHPVALQLGGSDPARLAEAAAIGEGFGYDEINLNVGCPSDRVQEGRFGACLMAEPELVAACVAAMRAARGRARHRQVPHRHRRPGRARPTSSGSSRRSPDAGCRTFIVHARKAWLQGLSPKENREVPPLDYARVYRLKAAHPELEIVLNGGIGSLCRRARRIWHTSTAWRWDAPPIRTPTCWPRSTGACSASRDPRPRGARCSRRLIPYVERHLAGGGRLNNVTRHILGLYHGRPRARAFRRHLSERAPRQGAGLEVLREAIAIAEADGPRTLAAAE